MYAEQFFDAYHRTMVPSLEAKKEIATALLHKALAARDGHGLVEWATVRDDIEATIQNRFPERAEEWSAISFEPTRIRDVDDPDGWERLCHQARSDGFEKARLLIQSIHAALSAAPPEAMPPIGLLCREILEGIFAIVATKSAQASVIFSPESFLSMGIARAHAERALENLTRRGILKHSGRDYVLGPLGKDLLDDPAAFDREVPRSADKAPTTPLQEPDPMPRSPRTATRLFISHAHADEALATAFKGTDDPTAADQGCYLYVHTRAEGWADRPDPDGAFKLALGLCTGSEKIAFTCVAVGSFYAGGTGTKPDKQAARRYYLLACRRGANTGCDLASRLPP